MPAIALSDAAPGPATPARRATRGCRRGRRARPIYRELARAGVMHAVSTYAGGPESAYRMTREGFKRKAELLLARSRQADRMRAGCGVI